MTWITNYPTKKAFREAVQANPEQVQVTDPSIFDPFEGKLATAMLTRAEIVVTNHPKRSWFAQVKRKPDGGLKVE